MGRGFDIAGVVPLQCSRSSSAHAIIITTCGIQIYIALNTAKEEAPLLLAGQPNKYKNFFKSLLPWSEVTPDRKKLMQEEGWAQEANERIKGSKFTIVALTYPPHTLSVQEAQE